MINVEHHDKHWCAMIDRCPVGPVQVSVESTTIGQAGECVGMRFYRMTDDLTRLILQLVLGCVELMLHPLIELDQLVHHPENGSWLLVVCGTQLVMDAPHQSLVLVNVGRDITRQLSEAIEYFTSSRSICGLRADV